MNRTIIPRVILTLGLTAVLLAATASTASAERGLFLWCAPLPTTPEGDGCIESHPLTPG